MVHLFVPLQLAAANVPPGAHVLFALLTQTLRRAREVVEVKEDALSELPKGLEKMKLEELKQIHAERSLPQAAKMTRASIILQVKDDVHQRSMLSRTAPSQSTKEEPSSGPAKQEDEDWDMPDQKASTRVKRQ